MHKLIGLNAPFFTIMACVIFIGSEEDEVLRVCKEEKRVDVLEVSKAKVGKDTYVGKESISTSREVYGEVALLM